MTIARRHLFAGLAAMPLGVPTVLAAKPVCAPDPQAEDWPDLSRYAAANQQLIATRAKVRLVFMGDSITQGWPDKRPEFFTSDRVCRGIGGQTTPQMLLRMMADVIALKPQMVHIMGGTNDIAGNTGPISSAQTIDNIAAMAALAKAHRIRVLIGSIPPAASFPWRPGIETLRTIATLNGALRNLALRFDWRFVDYTPALSDGAGGMRAGLTYDGVHPDTAGYRAMEQVLAPLL
jgi:lysophospholipase L1-like esterase